MVSAEEVGTALRRIADRLGTAGILTPEGQGVLEGEAGRIRRGRDSHAWRLTIDRGRPLTFARTLDKNGIEVTPFIVVDGIEAAAPSEMAPPFARLDMALEVHDLAGKPVARWHLDLANSGPSGVQDGPLFHLQYGGHNHGARHLDHPLKGPRWCHPPMEVGLFCEVVAANFFCEIWKRNLRDDGGWCSAIQTLQRVCYGSYLAMLQASLGRSASTALADMWADRWPPT